MSIIMEMLQRMTGPLRHALEATPAEEALQAAEVPPAVEIPTYEITPMPEMTPTSRHLILANWEIVLNEKVEEAIARRKSSGRPISIKEDPFTEDVMIVPLPLKFKESTVEFDGTTDPIDHIQTFHDRVRLHGWPDAIACKAFPMTLRKDAREWFDTLPPRSISSFADFANKFAICFSSSTRKRRLQWGLCKRGDEYIDQEEVLKATRDDRESYESGNKKRRHDEPLMSKPNTRFMTEYKYRPRTKNGDHPKEISEKVGNKRRAGVINVIVGGSAGGGDSRNSRKGYARSLHVNAIGVPSRFSQPITFSDEDRNGVSLLHDDALVITGDIAGFDVKRVLVDTGSAANILSWKAFKALKMLIDRLRSVNTPLQGFGGGTVILEGITDLPVVLGKHPC
ncbi:Reverse transcriptase domain-containing protein [Abeliophyllum distichum]|uniref:Reverse transcriptase domain-containing protein n=1 Tax=Abeliophyllum distichum TaxID=126358 RepID=A0ABD1RB89_9LAMI